MDKNKVTWGNDNFTKMVKEYGEKITKISEEVEKEIKDMLNESEEVNLFKAEIDKKKVK